MLRMIPLRCLLQSSRHLIPFIGESVVISRLALVKLHRPFHSSIVHASHGGISGTTSSISDTWDSSNSGEEQGKGPAATKHDEAAVSEHAVLSTFDLFSIGIGPSSSHTVGPMRAGAIFASDLAEANLLEKVEKIRCSLYGSLAATGEGHMTPSALLLGLEGESCETIDTASVPVRFESIKSTGKLQLGGFKGKLINFNYQKDFIFEFGRSLPLHSNGMRLTVFDKEGTMLATNDLFSVGGGFVVNGALSTATSTTKSKTAHPIDLEENIYYKEIKRSNAPVDRRVGIDTSQIASQSDQQSLAQIEGVMPSNLPATSSSSQQNQAVKATVSTQPPYPFRDAKSLLALCQKHNLTIAQLVYENERHWYTDAEIREKLTNIWLVMDNCIREGVHSDQEVLPGSLKLKRRAPGLYRRLTRGLYPSLEKPSTMQTNLSVEESTLQQQEVTTSKTSLQRTSLNSNRGPPRVHGSFTHPILPTPPRRTMFPTMDHLTVYAMAVNEVNACGGRVITAPTNGAVSVKNGGIYKMIVFFFFFFLISHGSLAFPRLALFPQYSNILLNLFRMTRKEMSLPFC